MHDSLEHRQEPVTGPVILDWRFLPSADVRSGVLYDRAVDVCNGT
jgi:hypothetical protein